MDKETLKKRIQNDFMMLSRRITTDAISFLLTILDGFTSSQQVIFLDKLAEAVKRDTGGGNLIDRDFVKAVSSELTRFADDVNVYEVFHVISSFDVPKIYYDTFRKRFFIDQENVKSILTSADEKIKMFELRHRVVLSKLLRQGMFSLEKEKTNLGKEKYHLRKMDDLKKMKSCPSVVLLGMLCQLKEGKYFLEDPNGFVELDLSGCTFNTGYFPENVIVIAEGKYQDKILYAKSIGLPPPEKSDISRFSNGLDDFFGSPKTIIPDKKVASVEKNNPGFSISFLSNIYLDSIETLRKLRQVFKECENLAAGVFVLMGNFLGDPNGSQKPILLRDAFKSLADILLEVPNVAKNFKIIMIPGPNDPGFPHILPRPPFADVITQYIRDKIPNVIFASNPFRIKYASKEIIIIRDDIMTKMHRNTIYYPETNTTIPDAFVKTIASQSHLCPLPINTTPIYWAHDHSLSLYPLPDVIVIADKGQSYDLCAQNSVFLNPGSFSTNNFQFSTYIPADNKIEICNVAQE